ncbi:MAG: hypothetical protein NXH95_22165 [Pseudomonadaceae bacterium]|nr:hypothetical protein [Pseudomonadaceae bacterium]
MSNAENLAKDVPVIKETLSTKTARWIDDPVGSVVAGIAFPTAAVGIVMGGIWGLGFVY